MQTNHRKVIALLNRGCNAAEVADEVGLSRKRVFDLARRHGAPTNPIVKPGGRIVVCGATSGPNPPSDLNRVFFLQLSVIGSTMGTLGELEQLVSLVSGSARRSPKRPILLASQAMPMAGWPSTPAARPVSIYTVPSTGLFDVEVGFHTPRLSDSVEIVGRWAEAAGLDGDLDEAEQRPVAALVAERAPATFKLALFALAAAILIAIPLGVLSASLRDGPFDHAVLAYSMLGAAVPNFWLGPLMMLFFAVKLGWLPVTGMDGPSNYVLPSVTLGLSLSCVLTRMVRTTMVEVLKQDYVTTARAKGLGWAAIHLKHALKNAMIPVITILGLQLGGLLGGAVITETIFDWSGIGELVYRGIQSRDFPLVQGCLLVIAVTYVAANTFADIAYTFANPRLEVQ